MTNEEFKRQLKDVMDEYAQSKTWWNPEDGTLVAFYRWLKGEQPK